MSSDRDQKSVTANSAAMRSRTLLAQLLLASVAHGLHFKPTAALRASCGRPAARRAAPVVCAEGGGALAQLGDQFEAALGSLPAAERYNAVLESLLTTKGQAGPALDLIDEMNQKRVRLSSKATKALLDFGVSSTNMTLLSRIFVAAQTNGACRNFAVPALKPGAKPSASALGALPELPTDDRASEVTAALAFTLTFGGLLALQLADVLDFFLPGIDISAPPFQLVLVGLAGGWGYDRYSQRGEWAGVLTRGLSRLFERDLQRECTVESGSFLLGYLLGLPCMAFAPTAERPLDMLVQAGELSTLPSGQQPRVIDRLLIWAMAPVAAEQLVYRESLVSEPELGLNLLRASRRREASLGVDVQQGGWRVDEDELRVRWAYAEARRLLQRYSGLREQLQESMVTGVSVGDCALLVEERLKNQWGSV